MSLLQLLQLNHGKKYIKKKNKNASSQPRHVDGPCKMNGNVLVHAAHQTCSRNSQKTTATLLSCCCSVGNGAGWNEG